MPYAVDSLLSFFGKDAASTEWKREVARIICLSAEQASHVQCVGMAKPIPIAEIYQPTHLVRPSKAKPDEEEEVPFERLLETTTRTR